MYNKSMPFELAEIHISRHLFVFFYFESTECFEPIQAPISLSHDAGTLAW